MLSRSRAEEEQRLRREWQEARESLHRAQLEHEFANKAGRNPSGLYRLREALERYTVALRDLLDFLLK